MATFAAHEAHAPENRVLARAAERAAELRATGTEDAIVAPLEVVAHAKADTVEILLDSLSELLCEQSRKGVIDVQAHTEIVHLRSRLTGWRDGWLGRTSAITIPVVALDTDGHVAEERAVTLTV